MIRSLINNILKTPSKKYKKLNWQNTFSQLWAEKKTPKVLKKYRLKCMNFDESGKAFGIFDITHWYLTHPLTFGEEKFSSFLYHNSDFPLFYEHLWFKKIQNYKKITNVLVKKLIAYSDSTHNFTIKSIFWWPSHGSGWLYGR